MSPKISIIMPVFNRADTIERAILSVFSQDYSSIELIVLDAGSTDGTVDIIKKYESRISYWHSQPDKGAADATNQGLNKASGELVGLLMADDIYEPLLFQAVAELSLAQPDTEIFSFGARIAKMQNGQIETITSLNSKRLMRLTFWNITINANPSICSRFIRLSLYRRIGLFNGLDEAGKQLLSNDQDFMLRALLAKAKETYLDTLGYTYFSHDESFSFNQGQQFFARHCREHIALARTFLPLASLTLKQRVILHYWVMQESIKLTLYFCIKKQFDQAFPVLLDALKKYHLLFAATFCAMTPWMVFKRLFRVTR